MLYSATKTLMVALAVLGFAASAPVDLVERDQKVIIGYRTMEKVCPGRSLLQLVKLTCNNI